MPADQIQYSERYNDDVYVYRHVILPPDLALKVPKSHLMTETEWRNLGVQQSQCWVHFMVHKPEPHVLLFRKPLPRVPPPREEPTPAAPAQPPNLAVSKVTQPDSGVKGITHLDTIKCPSVLYLKEQNLPYTTEQHISAVPWATTFQRPWVTLLVSLLILTSCIT